MAATAVANVPKREGLRVALYLRISQDEAGDALGVARQKKECTDLCGRHGWHVAGLYVDNDVSAFTGRVRPEYQRLLRDLRGGRFDMVVTWHPDRLHRSPRELEEFVEIVERAGVGVETVTTGRVDLSSPSGRLHARMLGSIARYESEHKSERLKAKMNELAHAGKVGGGGPRPFGFEQDRRRVREDEAILIREAASRVLAGDSLYSIVIDWTARGVATVTGKKWTTTHVRTFLCSARVAGLRSHHGAVVAKAEWPAILDEPTWVRVRAILMDSARARRRVIRSYLLTGILTCEACGNSLVATPRGRKHPGGGKVTDETGSVRAYGCVKSSGGCGRVYTLAEPVEAFVRDVVLRRLDGARLDRARKRLATGDDGAVLDHIADEEARIGQLARDFADRLLSRDAFLAAQRAIGDRVEVLRARLAEAARVSALDSVVDVRAEWNGLGIERQRAIIKAVLAKITVGPATGVRNRFNPERIKFVWRA